MQPRPRTPRLPWLFLAIAHTIDETWKLNFANVFQIWSTTWGNCFFGVTKVCQRDLVGIISYERPRFSRLNVFYHCVHRHRRGPPFSSFLRRPASRRGWEEHEVMKSRHSSCFLELKFIQLCLAFWMLENKLLPELTRFYKI